MSKGLGEMMGEKTENVHPFPSLPTRCISIERETERERERIEREREREREMTPLMISLIPFPIALIPVLLFLVRLSRLVLPL